MYYRAIFILNIISVYAKKILLMEKAPIQVLVPSRVIHYNFVNIELEYIFYDIVDDDEWNNTNN